MLKTSEQITEEFLNDLRAVLEKYDAFLKVEDDGFYSVPNIVVNIPTKFNHEDNTVIHPFTFISLGQYVTALKIKEY